MIGNLSKKNKVILVGLIVVILISSSFVLANPPASLGSGGHSIKKRDMLPNLMQENNKEITNNYRFFDPARSYGSYLQFNLSEPAPMGIADYGYNGVTDYGYNTSGFMGIVSINSLDTYNYTHPISIGHSMSIQLNVIYQVNMNGTQYYYWIQDVAMMDTSSNSIHFLNNIWNFSSTKLVMTPSTAFGNGSVVAGTGSWASDYIYIYDPLPIITSYPGNYVNLNYPSIVYLRVLSTYSSSGYPEVIFQYNDGYGWVTYDNVYFFLYCTGAKFSNGFFIVNGSAYVPAGYPTDAELILGGPGNGAQTQLIYGNIQMQLEYWNGNNFQMVTNAWNYGSDTAEGISNVTDVPSYDSNDGKLAASISNGPGVLGQLYTESDVSILKIYTHLPSGTLYVNNTPYTFVNDAINLTLPPTYGGYYQLLLYDSEGQLVWSREVSLSPGEFLVISAKPSVRYNVEFAESGLPANVEWSVTFNGSTFYSTSRYINLTEPFGVYNYTVQPVVGISNLVRYVTSESGSLIVNTSTLVLVAYSEQFYLTLSVVPPNGGFLSVSSGWYYAGSSLTLQAYPNANFKFLSWVGAGVGSYSGLGNPVNIVVESPINETAEFSLQLYSVDFNEVDLPPGTSWSVTLNGTTESSTSSTISFSEPNGSYPFTIGSVQGYTSSPSSGTVTVSGTSVVQTVLFSKAIYFVTFSESGLPTGNEWYATVTIPSSGLGGTQYSTSSSITFAEPLSNGSYTFTIGTMNRDYKPSPFSGIFTISGSNVTVAIVFVPIEYQVSFLESGLPSGISWSVTLDNITESSETNSIVFLVVNGTYSYTIATPDKIYKPSPYSGSLTINGAPVSESIAFSLVTYTVTFTESGLPTGDVWYVNTSSGFDSGPIRGTSYDNLSFSNGTYTYTFATSDHNYAPSPSSESFTVDGAPLTIHITFSLVTYWVTFTETGLPSGTAWYVNLTNGQTFSSTGSTISFSEPNGTYSYTIATSDHIYKPSSYSGSFTVNGASVSESVTFFEVTYSVTFTETGLPSGATWNVTLNGVKQSSSTSSITFSEPNGSYYYTVGIYQG
ncbi:MAG: thermopsin family protease, partial [Candidatus Micrarchaeaceae archaeon]